MAGQSPAWPDGAVHAFPVSVKGVAVQDGNVLLLENERAEWELPGGKLELGEDPAGCVAREISEESGWTVITGPLLDCWQYHIRPGVDVLIVTYGCQVLSSEPPVVSSEHKRTGLFTAAQVPGLNMPDGYKRSIAAWFARDGGPGLTRLGAVMAYKPCSTASLSGSRPAGDCPSAYRVFVLADACADPVPGVHDFLTEKIFPRQAHVITSAGLKDLLSGPDPDL